MRRFSPLFIDSPSAIRGFEDGAPTLTLSLLRYRLANLFTHRSCTRIDSAWCSKWSALRAGFVFRARDAGHGGLVGHNPRQLVLSPHTLYSSFSNRISPSRGSPASRAAAVTDSPLVAAVARLDSTPT